MDVVIDDKKWATAWMDTPMGMPSGLTEAQAFKTPGCAVKSRDPRAPHRFGRLASYSDELGARIVVIGHNSGISVRFVWTGTKAEYHRTWECD